jgi:hypothetical protein
MTDSHAALLMTDTFSSGFSTPPGKDAGEVTNTLAELERKLRELERELTSIGRRRVRPEGRAAEAPIDETAATSRTPPAMLYTPPAPSHTPPAMPYTPPASPHTQPTTPYTPPGAPPTAPRTPPATAGRLVDEQVEFHELPTPSAEPSPTLETDTERPRPTEAQLASLAELRRFRERLERFTKELLSDYDAVLSRAMSGVAGRVPSPPAAPMPEPAPPAQPAEPMFEGRVELGVGPFYDIGSLSDFEQLMADVPNVIEVAVRRFEASHAVVDVRLARPVALISELHRVLETSFSVRQVAPGRLQLAFEDA